jgi:hypothetical protein
MDDQEPTRQFAFRLPHSLVERIEDCVAQSRSAGLLLTRADVVRLLIHRGLDMTGGDPAKLLGQRPKPKSRTRR